MKKITIKDFSNNPQAQIALEIIIKGHSIAIYGMSGTAKSEFSKVVSKICPNGFYCIGPSLSSGRNIGGGSFYSYLGISPEVTPDSTEEEMKIMLSDDDCANIACAHDTIVIENCQQISSYWLDRIDKQLRRIIRKDEPFGGHRVIILADVLKPGPIVSKDNKWQTQGYNSQYFFDSEAYQLLQPLEVEFTKNYKYADPDFAKAINNLGQGLKPRSVIKWLNEHCTRSTSMKSIRRIKICKSKKEVETFNRGFQDMNPSNSVFIKAIGTGSEEAFIKQSSLKPTLRLKLYDRVFVTASDPAGEYNFRTTGFVAEINLDDPEPHITLLTPNGEIKIPRIRDYRFCYVREKVKKKFVTRQEILYDFYQFPLEVNWYDSFYHIQGFTLDEIEIVPSDFWGYGELYAVLSTCEKAEDIFLSSPIKQWNIKVNPKALEFLSTIRKRVCKDASSLIDKHAEDSESA